MTDTPAADAAPRFQFGLRTLLWLTVLVAVACGAWRWLGPFWTSALGWIAVLILAHVAGNRWGSSTYRLPPDRTQTPPAEPGPGSSSSPASGPSDATAKRVVAIVQTQHELALLQAVPLGRGSQWCAGVMGLLGALVAGLLAMQAVPAAEQWITVLVAALSAAVLAAGLGFLTGSFVEMSLHYLRLGLAPARTPVRLANGACRPVRE